MKKQEKELEQPEQNTRNWQLWISWAVTVILVVILVSILFWQPSLAQELNKTANETGPIDIEHMPELSTDALANMPYFEVGFDYSIARGKSDGLP